MSYLFSDQYLGNVPTSWMCSFMVGCRVTKTENALKDCATGLPAANNRRRGSEAYSMMKDIKAYVATTP